MAKDINQKDEKTTSAEAPISADEEMPNTAKGTVFDSDYDGELGNTKAAEKTAKNSQNPKGKMTKAKIAVIAASCVVVVGALVGVYFVVNNMPATGDSATGTTYPTDENGSQYAVDTKGNKIDADTDGNGNILSAGVKELIDKVPSQISKIDVSNESGTFTVTSKTSVVDATTSDGESTTQTQETQYTLVGFEDADLQSGQADAIANDAAAVETTKIVDINGENPQDYGLTEPRATVVVTFTDDEKDTIKVGNEVTGGEGVYIQVNDDKAIYLVDSDSVDSFFYSPLALLSTTVTDSASTEDDSTPQKFTISGSHYPQELVFVPNDDTTNTAYYKMTSPKVRPANVETGSSVIGSVLSLTAESVACYHPTDAQKKEYGIDDPYAQVVAEYANVTYTLISSKPNDVDSVYLYNKDKDTVYVVPSSKVPWATTSYDEMVYEYVMRPNKDSLSSIEVTIPNDKTYTFEMKTETSTDSSGTETSTSVATYNGTQLDTNYYDIFFQNIESAKREGTYDGKAETSPALTIKFNYNTGKESETITYYKGDDRKYLESYNGDNDSFVYDTYIQKIIEDTKTISQNKSIDSI